MRNQLSAQVNMITIGLLYIAVFFIPLLMLPLTTEFYETPKLIFLLAVVSLLLILRSLGWVLGGKVLVTRTPLDLGLLLLLIVIILSTVFSPVKDISILGNLPRLHGGAVSWVSYILFYFLAASILKSANQIKGLFLCLLATASLVALISLMSYFSAFLPFDFAQYTQFNPTGSPFAASALLTLLLPPLLYFVVVSNDFIPYPVALAVATLFCLVIALIGDFSTFVASLVGFGLIYLKFFKVKNPLVSVEGADLSNSSKARLPLLLVPLTCGVALFLLSVLPAAGKVNYLHEKYQAFSRELTLPFSTSWKVSASSFRDNPFLGSGLSTYLFDFTAYKPVEYNNTTLWNIRFDTAFNEYFQALASMGGLGLLALIFLSLVIINISWQTFSSSEDNHLAKALAISGIASVILLALHASTLVSLTTSLVILAMLMGLKKSATDKVEELSIGIKASKLTDSNLVVGDALPIMVLVPIIIILGFFWWKASQFILADYNHRMALNSASKNAVDTYNRLVAAEKLNPSQDLYRIDLAQTNFNIANNIALAKGPTQASPSGSLTDQDKQTIQTLLNQSINEGKAATTLNPLSAQNWEVLAAIYRQISGVAQNALVFSLDAYGKAISRDPLNPLLRLNIGGVYYSIKNYDLAIRFFTDAANLKPDYANAFYNLSVALRDKGDLQNAQAMAERVVALVDPKSPDYKTAGNYLADLKARIASNSAQANNAVPPAAQENGALQQKQLPKVVNLPNPPENIATPAAIKKPGATPAPSGQPSTAPQASPESPSPASSAGQ